MKTITPQDFANRTSNQPMYVQTLISIQCTNGIVINVTDGQQDISVTDPIRPDGLTVLNNAGQFPTKFYHNLYGSWQRGTIKSEATTSLTANDTSLTFNDNQQTGPVNYPNTSTPMMQVFSQGALDGATVYMWKVVMPVGQYGTTTQGVEALFRGVITKFENSGRSKFVFSVADFNYYLNLKTPPNVIMTFCRWTLFSQGCTLSRSSFLTSATVGSVVNAVTGIGNALVVYKTGGAWAHAAPYYNQGLIYFTSGQNKGIYYTIMNQQADQGLALIQPSLFPIAPGDTFNVSPGCDRQFSTCTNKFANGINFGGFPFIPTPETSL